MTAGTKAEQQTRTPEPAAGGTGKPPSKPIKVDFRDGGARKGGPFRKAGRSRKRLKLFLWGDSGVGKTTLALRFPRPVVLDMEGGTELYGDDFDFDVIHTTDPDRAMEAVDWLATHDHPYRTLVVDPITIFWDALQRKWSDIFLRRNKGSKGFKYEYYDLQVRDWMTIKAEFKEFVRKLLALNMAVVVTAREKTKYKDGSFMQAAGETFDGEKSLPYMFDVVLRLFLDDDGKHWAQVLKDRSNRLPKEPFPVDYAVFEPLVSGREAKEEAPLPANDEQKQVIRRLLSRLGVSEEKAAERFRAYGASSIDDLTAEKAEVIIGKLEAASAARKND